MATPVIDEIVAKAEALETSEIDLLIDRLKQKRFKSASNKKNGDGNGSVHPNTIWIKENKHKYPGHYVALKDGVLVAVGRTIKEAHLASKANGVDNPLLHYIFPKGYEPWAGW